jgi:hypothetical protein
MQVIAHYNRYDVVEYGPEEVLPQPYDAGSQTFFTVIANYPNAQPQCHYYKRAALAPETQLKIWEGLADPAVVAQLLAQDTVAQDVPWYAGQVEGKRKLTLTCGLVGLWKPTASDSGDGNAWSEVAAYQLDRAIGANLVPVTVWRNHPLNSQERGSMQLWVAGIQEAAAPTNDVRFFDRLAANTDRGAFGGNNMELLQPARPVLVDNGCSFLAQVTANNALNDRAQITPGGNLLQATGQLDAHRVAQQLTALPGPQQTALVQRARMLVYVIQNGQLPNF